MTDELISKTDVVKIVKSVLSPASSLTNVARARRQMLNEINELESKPEPHWIPVTERLPEINEDILLSYFDEVTIGWLCGDGSWMIFDGQECASADEISAWMPLPEPYKEVTT